MKGKDKCKLLKEIRAQIAAANEIEWVTENCSHKGECRGTCPKCESEVAALERALDRRRALGKTVAVVGLSAGMITSMASCGLIESWGIGATEGDMEPPLAGGMTAAVTTVAATSDLPEPGGALPAGQYSNEYEICDPIEYRAHTALVASCLHDLILPSDPLCVDVAAGERFAVIGHCDDRLMIEYEGARYWIYESELSACAEPVEPVETTD